MMTHIMARRRTARETRTGGQPAMNSERRHAEVDRQPGIGEHLEKLEEMQPTRWSSVVEDGTVFGHEESRDG
jgi:hypothetical protein